MCGKNIFRTWDAYRPDRGSGFFLNSQMRSITRMRKRLYFLEWTLLKSLNCLFAMEMLWIFIRVDKIIVPENFPKQYQSKETAYLLGQYYE
jgi:hypothetical protein